jgi:hypothetical protein|nr:MAG TPA: hypothetical protein [Caudoviricetes sp.]
MSYIDFIVPYGMAKQLKEIGFDSPCFFYYNNFGHMLYKALILDYNKDRDLYSAPTYDQVYKWFADRECYLEFDFSSSTKFGGFVNFKGVHIMLEEYSYEALRAEGILEMIELYKNRDTIKDLKVENGNILEW